AADTNPSLTFSIAPPVNGRFAPTPSSVQASQFALAPDGRRLVFVGAVGRDAPRLWIRPLDSLTPEPLASTDEAEYPFWSPDGESIGFFAGGYLKCIDLAGGPARALAPAAHGRGGSWNRDRQILFAPAANDAIYMISASGGTPAR